MINTNKWCVVSWIMVIILSQIKAKKRIEEAQAHPPYKYPLHCDKASMTPQFISQTNLSIGVLNFKFHLFHHARATKSTIFGPASSILVHNETMVSSKGIYIWFILNLTTKVLYSRYPQGWQSHQMKTIPETSKLSGIHTPFQYRWRRSIWSNSTSLISLERRRISKNTTRKAEKYLRIYGWRKSIWDP